MAPRHLLRLPLVVIATLVTALASYGQTTSETYPDYLFDSTFVIGGYDINRTWLQDSVTERLGFNALAFYGAPTHIDSATIAQSTDSGFVRLRTLVDWNAQSGRPAKYIYTPSHIGALGKRGTALESYAGNNSAVLQVSTFEQLDTSGAFEDDFYGTRHIYGWTAPAFVGPERILSDRPRYTQRAFVDTAHLAHTYQSIDSMRPPHTTSVSPVTIAGLYSSLAAIVPAYADSSHYYYVSLAFKVNTSLASIAPTDTLMNITLFKRDYFQQDTLLCNIYVPFKTAAITRDAYENGTLTIEDDYREYSLLFSNIWKTTATSRHLVSRYFPGAEPVNGCGTCSSCDALINSRRARPTTDTLHLPAGTFNAPNFVVGSDFYYRVTTTGKVGLTLLRGTVSTHLHHRLSRSTLLDTLVRFDVASLYRDSVLNATYRAFGMVDEPSFEQHKTFGILSRKVQRYLRAIDPVAWNRRNVATELYGNYDGLRAFSNDFDTTALKSVQIMISDRYLAHGHDPISLHYANPERMSLQATDTLYRMRLRDTLGTRRRMIIGTSPSDYQFFTKRTQDRFGTFSEMAGATYATLGTPSWLPNLARCVDVAQFRYRDRGPGTPVYLLADVHGMVEVSGLAYKREYWKPIPTPEEIRAQAWLGMNCGVNGILFSEMIFGGSMIGPLRIDTSLRGNPANANYDRLVTEKSPTLFLDTTWVGYTSRWNAIKEVTRDLRYIDSVIGWKNLRYEQEQISVHDTTMAFRAIPMVDTLLSELAVDTIQAFTSYSPRRYDERSATFVELTHLWPRRGDSTGTARNARYILVTNRRIHPMDFNDYDTLTRRKFDTAAGANSAFTRHKLRGLGNIDVRRPALELKNSTSVIAKRLLVERIDTGAWSVNVPSDSLFSLQWLRPGQGALYRITPIAAGISLEGSAYNNAIRSENPSGRGTDRDRIVVYERDSIVYLRALDSNGLWGDEWRVSDALDTTDTLANAYWQRRASNFHPSIATVRNDTACMVVWERTDGSGNVTIEGAMFSRLPVASDTTLPDTMRIRVAPARPFLQLQTAHAPAIIGLDGGYAIAYPSTGPGGGISVTLLANRRDTITTADSISAHHIRWLNPVAPSLVDTAYFPTLAYRSNISTMPPSGDWTCIVASGESPGSTGSFLHLAYQQGKLNTANAQYIMYNMLGARFKDRPFRPVLWISPTEHVSAGLPGCGFLHPSIAADVVSVGVAFQANDYSTRRVALRYRPDISIMPYQKWNTVTYAWVRSGNRYLEWPSLTSFPALGSSAFTAGPQGAIVWYRTNDTGNRSTQYLYRIREQDPHRIMDGQFPTMTLVAKLDTNPFEASSVFFRGDSTTRVSGSRPFNTTGYYYPARLENSPLLPSALFTTTYIGNQLGQVMRLGSLGPGQLNSCSPTFKWVDVKLLPRQGLVAPPPLPPIFFGSGTGPSPVINTAVDGQNVTRTGNFLTGGEPTSIGRHISRTSEFIAWLNAQPYDTTTGPHNIRVFTELVRSADDHVLWSDDTISVRGMSADTSAELVAVPTHLVASNTSVYIRIRAVPTVGLAYDVTGSFEWDMDSAASQFIPKASQWRQQPKLDGQGTSAKLALEVSPNPANQETTLWLYSSGRSRVTIDVFDQLGRHVRSLPGLDAAREGRFAFRIDVGDLPVGAYVVSAGSDGSTAAALLNVVR
jgi:hypothetical protein